MSLLFIFVDPQLITPFRSHVQVMFLCRESWFSSSPGSPQSITVIWQLCLSFLFLSFCLPRPSVPWSDVIIHERYVWVRKTSLALWGLYVGALVLRGWCYHGYGGGGIGGRGRTGRKMQQQVTLWAVDVHGLRAVFTAAGLLSSLYQVLQ